MKGHPVGSLCVLVKTLSGKNVGSIVRILGEPKFVSGVNMYTDEPYSAIAQEVEFVWSHAPVPNVEEGNIVNPPEWMRPLSDPYEVERDEKKEIGEPA